MKDKKIKILIGINDFSFGGAQKIIVDLLHFFNYENFEFHLITFIHIKDKSNFYHLLDERVVVHEINFKNLYNPIFFLQLRTLIKNINPDVIWSHLFFSNTVLRISSIGLKIRHIITEQNTYINKPIRHRLLDLILSFMTFRIVAVSREVRDFTSQQEKIPIKKFHIIYNCVDTSEIDRKLKESPEKKTILKKLSLENKTPIFINVARLVPQKNHELLLRGFNLFLSSNKHAQLLIIGDGYLLKNLEKQAIDLRIDSHVHFLGFREDVETFYKISDCFVSTSSIEGLSVAYLEALSAGLPIVATLTAGTDEILQDNNGFIIEDASPQGICNMLQKFTDYSKSFVKDDIVESVKRFDVRKIALDYENLFLEAVGKR